MPRLFLGWSAAVLLWPAAVLAQPPAKLDPLQSLAHATAVQGSFTPTPRTACTADCPTKS